MPDQSLLYINSCSQNVPAVGTLPQYNHSVGGKDWGWRPKLFSIWTLPPISPAGHQDFPNPARLRACLGDFFWLAMPILSSQEDVQTEHWPHAYTTSACSSWQRGWVVLLWTPPGCLISSLYLWGRDHHPSPRSSFHPLGLRKRQNCQSAETTL